MLSELHEFPDRLLRAIGRAPVIPEGDIPVYVRAGGRLGRRSDFGALTARELEALRYFSRGLTREQTGSAMCASTETVGQHLKIARYKLKAKNSTHACCEAIRLGLIP